MECHGKRSTDLGPGRNGERVARGLPADTPSGSWRTPMSTTFQDMISTKFDFDFERFFELFQFIL